MQVIATSKQDIHCIPAIMHIYMKVLYKPAAKNICIQAVMTTSSKQTMWFAPIQEKHLYTSVCCTYTRNVR